MSNHDILHQTGTRIIELDIEGMTCASCVARVERKLGKLDGVEASVNLPSNQPTSQSRTTSRTNKSWTQ
ncbi:copper-exporting P-type ATPase A [Arthrobacter sp. Hiyo8]|nr:copper-exporting P-type ATPase A [Arthrobacter sp. Hiyo8]